MLPLFMCYSLLVGVAVLGGTAWSDNDRRQQALLDIARCRAACVNEYVSEPATNDKCRHTGCKLCYEICFSLYSDSLLTNICSGVCEQPACSVACDFYKLASEKKARNPLSANFTLGASVEIEANKKKYKFKLNWERPVFKDARQRNTSLVYMFMRRKSPYSPWKDAYQTISPNAEIDVRRTDPAKEEFRLDAIGMDGVEAEFIFKPLDHLIMQPKKKAKKNDPRSTSTKTNGDDLPPVKGSPKNDSLVIMNDDISNRDLLTPRQLKQDPEPISNVIPLDMDPQDWTHLNVTKRQAVENDMFNVYLSWPAVADMFTFSWGLYSCEVYPDTPTCDEPPDFYSEVVWRTNSSQKEIKFVLKGLMFNSQYFVEVMPAKVSGYKLSRRIEIVTPYCHNPSTKFTKCMDNENFEPPYVWLLHSELRGSHVLTHKVFANITWEAPNNYTGQYEVLWHERTYKPENGSSARDTEGVSTTKREVNGTQTILMLEKDAYYTIEVKTMGEVELKNGEMWYITSQRLRLNTSSLLVTMPPLDEDENLRELQVSSIVGSRDLLATKRDSIIIAVSCIVGFMLFLLIFVVIYRRCRKEFELVKTVGVKSNSYKVPFGGKDERTDPLLLVRDEWEVEPSDLKLGVLMGQGAFGKVMHAHFEARDVAVKILKDNAPLSYREDFYAEINLMKRLGSHPHIVALVGAVTLTEPLALVLEYMPFGSLQSFLKKCRQDGCVHTDPYGNQELLYSEINSDGDVECWTITPSDVLSFARQVALAMEYIADKRFVHRDLAARNVLVGENKLVKLCDFGLSRDVYGTSAYHKLTNGKLPLKWMALESLRDRVFTFESDVWSFGVLLWEIVTMGGSPYADIALADLYTALAAGYRMERPNNCAQEVYSIMAACWSDRPEDRPTFSDIRENLEVLLGHETNYLQLDNIDVPLQESSTSDGRNSATADDFLTGGNTSAEESLLAAVERVARLPPPRESERHARTAHVVHVGADDNVFLEHFPTSASGYLEARSFVRPGAPLPAGQV